MGCGRRPGGRGPSLTVKLYTLLRQFGDGPDECEGLSSCAMAFRALKGDADRRRRGRKGTSGPCEVCWHGVVWQWPGRVYWSGPDSQSGLAWSASVLGMGGGGLVSIGLV